MNHFIKKSLSVSCIGLAITNTCLAQWTTYRADNRRSGTTAQTIKLPLTKSWNHQGGIPQQAWTGPAKWDTYAKNAGLQSMRNFDPCYYTTIADGKLYYGSSSDNAVHCFDINSGKELWTFFTNSAVRFPPSLANNRAFFGSDDGHAYAVDTTNGNLIWKVNAAPTTQNIINNGKLISTHPVRTGVTLVGDQAIFAGSLLPWEDSYLHAVTQKSGKSTYVKKAHGKEEKVRGYNQAHTGVTLQGAILTDNKHLYIPQGRAAALKFDVKSGNTLGNMGHAGGVFCILTEDSQLIAGPSSQKNRNDQISLTDQKGRSIAAFNNANRAVIYKGQAFMHINGSLKGLDYTTYSSLSAKRADTIVAANKIKKTNKPKYDQLMAEVKGLDTEIKACSMWETPAAAIAELIVAGDHLICGFDGKVEIYDTKSGKSLWSAPIEGIAHGLSVSDGHLVVSTNKGEIISFK